VRRQGALYLDSLQQIVDAFLCLGRKELEGHSGLALSIGLLDTLNDAPHAADCSAVTGSGGLVFALVCVFAKLLTRKCNPNCSTYAIASDNATALNK
jgi:hypothetical protein